MPCNCRKSKVVVRFKLTMADGSTSIHGTRRSAEMANSRNGGGGTISKVE